MTAARRVFLILAARDWIGTPFHHNARVLGHGVDCAQLVAAAGLGAGLLEVDPPELKKYASIVRPRIMGQIISKYFDEVTEGQIGDILWLNTRRNMPLHLAIVTENGIIHASADSKKVVETALPLEYKSRINSIWQFKALKNG